MLRLVFRCIQVGVTGAVWERDELFLLWLGYCQMISLSKNTGHISWSLSQTAPHPLSLFWSSIWSCKSPFHLGSRDDVCRTGWERVWPFCRSSLCFIFPFLIALRWISLQPGSGLVKAKSWVISHKHEHLFIWLYQDNKFMLNGGTSKNIPNYKYMYVCIYVYICASFKDLLIYAFYIYECSVFMHVYAPEYSFIIKIPRW